MSVETLFEEFVALQDQERVKLRGLILNWEDPEAISDTEGQRLVRLMETTTHWYAAEDLDALIEKDEREAVDR